MYRKILLAADGSEHSKGAAQNAINLAKMSKGSFVEIVYAATGINRWQKF